MELKEQIASVNFLLKRGFELISSQSDSVFGNYCMVLELRCVRVRITRDRRQYLVYVAPSHQEEEWFDLSLILQAFGRGKTKLDLNELESQVPHLEDVLSELDSAFERTIGKIHIESSKSKNTTAKGNISNITP